MKSLIFVIIIFLPACIATDNSSITLPLTRHKTPREIAINIKGIKGLSTEYLKPNYFKPPRNGTNDTIAVFRYMDSEFYAVVQIGKKARPFNLAIDTAWGHSWVLSEDCPYANIGCWFHNKYDHTKSSSYIENGTGIIIQQNNYNLSGYFSKDTFHLEQLNVTNQTFIEMVSVPHSYILTKADGVLGLGYASLSKGVTPVFYNLYQQGRIKKLIFAIYLNRDRSSNRGGNIYLGRIEDRHILKNETVTYLQVKQTGYWQFEMDRIELDNGNKTFPFCLRGCDAIVDTSTNTITGPESEIFKLNRLIGAKYIMYDRYQVPCDIINKLPLVSFVLDGKNFTLHGRDYVQQVSYKSFTLCLSAFKSSKKNFWVLGGAFLAEYYSIYSLEDNLIGFVKAA